MTDAQLLHDYCQSGSQESFAELVRRYGARLHSWCLLFCGGRSQTAQDAVQETWLNVVKYCRRFDGRCRFSTWIMGIARTKAIDCARKEQAARHHDQLRLSGEATSGHASDRLISSEEIDRLNGAFDTLAANHQRIVALLDFGGLDYAAAAAIEDIPVGTVRSRRHRALENLRKRMAA